LNPPSLEAVHSRLGPHGDRWSLAPMAPGAPAQAPASQVVPAAGFLDERILTEALTQLAGELHTSNLRAVASFWQKHYVATLLIPVLSALTIAGAGLDASTANVSLALDQTGLPRRLLLRPSTPIRLHAPRWNSSGRAEATLQDLQRFVLQSVRENHLVPLIDLLRELTGIPRRILWVSTANVIADVYDGLAQSPYQEAAAEDRAALLDSPVDLITGGPNPLHNLVRYEPVDVPGLPPALRCRAACCQRYSLPGYQPCTTCPRLSLDERINRTLAHKKR
jgi:ferric iron reductase protein FhuF